MREKADIRSMTLAELQKDLEARGEKPFRAKQMYEWMHVKLAEGFEEMTNLSKVLRENCKLWYTYTSLKTVQIQESGIDGTKKFLFGLSDGNVVEMLAQVYAVTRLTGERVSNVVVMGTGEPLDNYDNLLRFIALLTDENGLHISQRNVTVSTCGIVPKIRQLAEEHLQITLALSLHAATDEKRRMLMPIAERYSIGELMEACRYYFEQTGRRITFEYSLVNGVNDTTEDAGRLAALAKPLNCHVNLIPVNPIKERDYVQSEAGRVRAFQNMLEKKQINGTIRREMGRDIDGACGQLRRRHLGSLPDSEGDGRA